HRTPGPATTRTVARQLIDPLGEDDSRAHKQSNTTSVHEPPNITALRGLSNLCKCQCWPPAKGRGPTRPTSRCALARSYSLSVLRSPFGPPTSPNVDHRAQTSQEVQTPGTASFPSGATAKTSRVERPLSGIGRPMWRRTPPRTPTDAGSHRSPHKC